MSFDLERILMKASGIERDVCEVRDDRLLQNGAGSVPCRMVSR
jgi:hypothetical protein